MDWFLFGTGLRHEIVKVKWGVTSSPHATVYLQIEKEGERERLQPATSLKLTLFHGCFSPF